MIRSASPEKAFLYDDDGNMIQGYQPPTDIFSSAAYDAENHSRPSITPGAGGSAYQFQYLFSANGALADGEKLPEQYIDCPQPAMSRTAYLPLQERDASNAVQRPVYLGPQHGRRGIGGCCIWSRADRITPTSTMAAAT